MKRPASFEIVEFIYGEFYVETIIDWLVVGWQHWRSAG
jgi:hypothetical protein